MRLKRLLYQKMLDFRNFNIIVYSFIPGILLTLNLYAQPFTEIITPIPGVTVGSAAWGDYDNDNDLDLIIMGDSTTTSTYFSRIYRNDDSTFTDINAPISNVSSGSVEWGDYDNDGDLDLLLMGFINATVGVIKIYRNDNGTFNDIGGNLRPMERGNASWGDYDNDGDLDFVVCGASLPNGIFSRVYKNMGNDTFNEIDFELANVYLGKIGWIDYDLDNDLDIFLTGQDLNGNLFTKLYDNEDSTFTDSGLIFPNLSWGSFSWSDIDMDGDPDLLLSGSLDNNSYARILINNRDNFSDGYSPQAFRQGSGVWGDVNNDLWPDLLIAGSQSMSTYYASILQNTGMGSFVDIHPGFAQIYGITLLGDYDNDHDLDVVLAGNLEFHLYRNDNPTPSPLPVTPENLTSIVSFQNVMLSWSPGSGGHLTHSYNVRIGNSPGAGNDLSAMSDSAGNRLIPQPGNAAFDTSLIIRNLSPGTYYWSVQAINANYTGSAFAIEDSFTVQYDPNNHIPLVENEIPNQALVLNRDIFERNLLASPPIFLDPDGDVLYFSAWSSDTLLARTQLIGSQLVVIPQDTGTVLITINATDSISGSVESSFLIYSIPVPQKTTFTESFTFEPLYHGSTSWGDFDNDEDLDLLITGFSENTNQPATILYRNDNGNFIDVQANLTGVYFSDSDWGDFDNDGDLDLVISGYADQYNETILYKNENSVFSRVASPFDSVSHSSVAWGDYDNDGDLDLILSGMKSGGGKICKLYRNDDGQFTQVLNDIPGIAEGSITWGDYDNDGDLDLLITGESKSGNLTEVLRNDSSTFTPTPIDLTQLQLSSASFGDYDNDGDLDILICGQSDTDPVSKVYQNQDGNFIDIMANMDYVHGGSVEWGDYDNDGDFDILITGYSPIDSTFLAKIYENYLGSFVDTELPFEGVDYSDCQWGDYDKDGDLDFVLSGINYLMGPVGKLYENELMVQNNPPVPPNNLQAQLVGDELVLSWNKGLDLETQQNALTYNLRVGTTPNGNEIISPMSENLSGFRFMPHSGNVFHNTTWHIVNIRDSVIYWSVQTIDNAYAGSEFANTQQIVTKIVGKKENPIKKFQLFQNYPNPFNPSTTITFTLPKTSQVKLKIFNILGEEVTTLVSGRLSAGSYSYNWDTNNLASGVYLYRLQAGSYVWTKKMVLRK